MIAIVNRRHRSYPMLSRAVPAMLPLLTLACESGSPSRPTGHETSLRQDPATDGDHDYAAGNGSAAYPGDAARPWPPGPGAEEDGGDAEDYDGGEDPLDGQLGDEDGGAPPPVNECDDVYIDGVTATAGSGIVEEQVVLLPDTPRFRISGPFQADLYVDPAHSGDIALSLRADDNILPQISAGVQEGEVVVELAQGAFCDLTELAFDVTVSNLSQVSAINAAVVRIHGLDTDSVALGGENASVIHAEGQADEWNLNFSQSSQGFFTIGHSGIVNLELASASEVTITGSATETNLNASTASQLIATTPTFETERAHVEMQGLSHARLCVRDAVDGTVADLSQLFVAGSGNVAVSGAAHRQ